MTYTRVALSVFLLSPIVIYGMDGQPKVLANVYPQQNGSLEENASIPTLRSFALDAFATMLVEQDSIKGINSLDFAQEMQNGPHCEDLAKILAISSVDVFREHNNAIAKLVHEPEDNNCQDSPNAFAFSPDGKKLAVSTKRLTIWDMSNLSGEPIILEDPLIGAEEAALRWSQDGTKIYACKEGTLLCWDVIAQRLLYSYVLADRTQQYINNKMYAFSPDGKYLLGVKNGPRGNQGKYKNFAASRRGILYEVDFVPDTRSEIALGERIELPHTLFDAHKKTWQNGDNYIGSRLFVAFSPNGQYAVTAGCDFTLRLHDISALPDVKTICYEHEGTVTAVAFSPDGNTMITATNEIRPWDVEKTRQGSKAYVYRKNC